MFLLSRGRDCVLLRPFWSLRTPRVAMGRLKFCSSISAIHPAVIRCPCSQQRLCTWEEYKSDRICLIAGHNLTKGPTMDLIIDNKYSQRSL